MRKKKLNPKLLWVLFEDVLAPGLGLTVKDRAVYSYLMRHTLVVGKRRVHFAVSALARILGMSAGRTRESVRRLDELGALHVLERGKTGHVAEMRLPENVLAIRSGGNAASPAERGLLSQQHAGAVEEHSVANIETRDFWKTWCSAKPFTIASAALAFTAFGGHSRMCGASTTLCHASATGAIPTGTWFRAVSNATQASATVPHRIFCAFSTVRVGSRRPNWTGDCSP